MLPVTVLNPRHYTTAKNFKILFFDKNHFAKEIKLFGEKKFFLKNFFTQNPPKNRKSAKIFFFDKNHFAKEIKFFGEKNFFFTQNPIIRKFFHPKLDPDFLNATFFDFLAKNFQNFIF